jgi:hypothetical protein
MEELSPPNNAPNMLAHEQAEIVLLLTDVINDLEFEGGEQLLPFAMHCFQYSRIERTGFADHAARPESRYDAINGIGPE